MPEINVQESESGVSRNEKADFQIVDGPVRDTISTMVVGSFLRHGSRSGVYELLSRPLPSWPDPLVV